MEVFEVISLISLLLAIISFLIIWFSVKRHSQPMRVMNIVWPLTALWGGLFALWAYFSFGIAKQSSMNMEMGMMDADMKNDGGMKMEDMDGLNMIETNPFWQKIALSTFHCGAGCTLADIIGETFGPNLLVTLGLQSIGWMWGLDYLLALIVGACFQYVAIRPMQMNLTSGEVFMKALKVDFLSLTAWQIGMYAMSYLVYFVLLPGPLPHDTLTFWFVMQLAMVAGFFLSYPMNWLLVKRGIKPMM